MSLTEQTANPIPARPETVDLSTDPAFAELVKRLIGLTAEATTTAAELKKINEARRIARASVLDTLGERKRAITLNDDLVTWKMVATNYKAVPAKPARTVESKRLTVLPGEPRRAN